MAQLIYSVLASLDGYIADRDGNFDWAMPDVEVHTFVNDLERPVATYLYGRRMYEVMVAWETMGLTDQAPYLRDYQEIWRAADNSQSLFGQLLGNQRCPNDLVYLFVIASNNGGSRSGRRKNAVPKIDLDR